MNGNNVMKNKSIVFIAALVVLITLISAANVFSASYIYYGSTDTQAIKTIQTKLKNWGYYTGSVDGIFGYQTEQAVRYFQSKNGLTVDGKVGNETFKALGMMSYVSSSSSSSSSGSGSYTSESDVMLLARVVNGEARGEPYEGQVAVAAVILNRVEDDAFPDTISGVVYQNGAFDAVADGQVNLTPNDSCIRAARDALNGWDPTGGAIYYYNPKTATNQWIRTRPIICTIGNHVFCK